MIQLYEPFALIILLVLSAFFAAAEVAFLSISNVKIHTLLERKVPGAELLAHLRQSRRRVIISLLIGNSISNVAASALGTSMAIDLFGNFGVGIAVGVMFLLILTFGEIAPKSAATTYGEKAALFLAPFIELFYHIVFPLVILFEIINNLIPGVYSKATKLERFTEEEVLSAVKLGAQHQSISEKERELIENVLEFNDRTVSQVMTSRSSAFTLDAKMPVKDAHRIAVNSRYSRFPVMNNGDVVGIASARSLGRALYTNPEGFVGEVMLVPVTVKSSETAASAFNQLQSLGRNMAIVTDEKGDFAGVITMEDLLEELVGEIK